MRNLLISLNLLLLIPYLAESATFKPWDISSDNRLLLTASTKQPEWETFNTAMMADLNNQDTISFLTHFPEASAWHPATNELEVYNRFGLFRNNISDNAGFRRLPFIPGISEQGVSEGQILAISSSPDGRWILVQEATGPIRGNLVLYDTQKRDSHQVGLIVSRNHIFEYYSSSSENFRNTSTGVDNIAPLAGCGLLTPGMSCIPMGAGFIICRLEIPWTI